MKARVLELVAGDEPRLQLELRNDDGIINRRFDFNPTQVREIYLTLKKYFEGRALDE